MVRGYIVTGHRQAQLLGYRHIVTGQIQILYKMRGCIVTGQRQILGERVYSYRAKTNTG